MTLKNLLLPALASLMAFAASGKAFANDNIDFSEVSCREFMDTMETAAREDSAGMMLWLDGYVTGLSGTPVLDWGRIEELMDRIASRCRQKGSARLLDVIERGHGRR